MTDDNVVAKLKSLNVVKILEDMTAEVGLPKDFLPRLFLEPDDWAFVIKTHALMESVVCTLIATHLNAPQLEDVLSESVEMSARVKILSSLDLLDSRRREMLRALGNLRNKLVHNARQVSFTFADHLSNKDRRAEFSKKFGSHFPDLVAMHAGATMPRAHYVAEHPRHAMWIDALAVVSAASGAKAQRRIADLEQKHMQAMTAFVESLDQGDNPSH